MCRTDIVVGATLAVARIFAARILRAIRESPLRSALNFGVVARGVENVAAVIRVPFLPLPRLSLAGGGGLCYTYNV